ncbi:MAG: invasion associated locus B family protein [Rhodospirillales bacterium]
MTVQANPDLIDGEGATATKSRYALSPSDAQYLQRLTAGFGAFFSIAMLLITLASVAKAETLSEHGPWAAIKNQEDGKPVCYIGAEPKKQEGDYTRRGDTYVIVTHRPAMNQNNVVSVLAGYTYKDRSEVVVKINGDPPVKLFTRDQRAWAYDAKTDAALVNAMKRGTTMVITGTSSRGTLTTDTYSLSGFTAAYNDASRACGL